MPMRPTAPAKLKIQFVTGIFPPDIGGPATYVPQMATALTQQGHQVEVLTLSEAAGQAERYPFAVTRIRRGLPKPWRVVRTVAALVRAGRSADLFFVHGLYFEAAIANLMLRKPLVQKWVGDWAWEHALERRRVRSSFAEFQEGWSGWRAQCFKALRNFCARRADALIAPSGYLARALEGWGVAPERIATIYNAVDCQSVAPGKIPLAVKFKIVTVGRLIAIKQIDRIIQAIAAIEDAGLVIVGDGPERCRLEALARDLGLSERIYFAGQRSREETLALMAGGDLFVLNSTHEGLPHVVLEAMSLGVPVVATAVGGTPEVIRDGENGLLIAPHANGELRQVLSRLMPSPGERTRLAREGKRTAASFSHLRMIEQTAALLETTARGDNREPGRSLGAVATHNG
jgi:glycosyltransferase involved in cell wall biosynthesis